MESSIGDGSGGFLDVELIVEVAMRAREISLHFGDVGVAARPRATFVFVDFRIFVVEIGIDDMPRSERIDGEARSEEHTSELQSLMRTSYAVYSLKKKKQR